MKTRLRILPIVLFLLTSVSHLIAQNAIFNKADDDWALPQNWSTGSLPGPGNVAIVNQGRIVNVTAAVSQTPDVIRIGNNAAGATLKVRGGSLAGGAIQAATAIGSSGEIHLSGGSLVSNGSTFLASQNTDATASLILAGGSFNWGTSLTVGGKGIATVTVDGGDGLFYRGTSVTIQNGGLAFLFGESGVNFLEASSSLTIGNSSTLLVDGAAYTGSGGIYTLIGFGGAGRTGDFIGRTTIVNFEPRQALLQYNDLNRSIDLLVVADLNQDTTGNGLPDVWELENFGTVGVDPQADPDGDGTSNLMEFLAGTDPNNSSSAFRPTVARQADATVVSIPTVPGRTYRLLGSSDLLSWVPLEEADGDGSVIELVHEAAASDAYFLRVEVFRPYTMGSVLDTIPTSGAEQAPGTIAFSTAFVPSGSTWARGLRERDVFLASMDSGSWRLGIGKGGHIYSLRGPFGESVPPQRPEAPWTDEAWQMVSTSNELVGPIQQYQRDNPDKRSATLPLMFFLHQSGIYTKGEDTSGDSGTVEEPYYSPILRKEWNEETRAFSVVSWAQHSRAPNVWRSGGLIFATYRDLGEGTIEVTQVLHNFGDEPLTHLNGPWGGVRYSSLPHTILSNADGSWQEVQGSFADGLRRDVRDTAGWKVWVQNMTNEAGPALSLVFGTEPGPLPDWKTNRSFLRYGEAGALDTRDYEVSTHISRIVLNPGESVAARWYLVIGPFQQVRSKGAALAHRAGVFRPKIDRRVLQPIWLSSGVPVTSGAGTPPLAFFAHPVPGTVPVFLMEDTRTGERFVTTDPYALTGTVPFANPLPSDHSEFWRYQNRVLYLQHESPGVLRDLLGFAYASPPPAGSASEVSLPGADGGAVSFWVPWIR
jgi:hypothetical protein